jgi:hypothetical protein
MQNEKTAMRRSLGPVGKQIIVAKASPPTASASVGSVDPVITDINMA